MACELASEVGRHLARDEVDAKLIRMVLSRGRENWRQRAGEDTGRKGLPFQAVDGIGRSGNALLEAPDECTTSLSHAQGAMTERDATRSLIVNDAKSRTDGVDMSRHTQEGSVRTQDTAAAAQDALQRSNQEASKNDKARCPTTRRGRAGTKSRVCVSDFFADHLQHIEVFGGMPELNTTQTAFWSDQMSVRSLFSQS